MAPHVCDRVVLAAVFAAVEAEATRRLASGELGVGKGGSMRMWAWMKQTLASSTASHGALLSS
jgi:hypothetical protein